MQIYRTIMVLLQYVMPLSVIIWAYSSISFALWGNTAPGNAQTDRDANLMRNKKRVSSSKSYNTYLNLPHKQNKNLQLQWITLKSELDSRMKRNLRIPIEFFQKIYKDGKLQLKKNLKNQISTVSILHRSENRYAYRVKSARACYKHFQLQYHFIVVEFLSTFHLKDKTEF